MARLETSAHTELNWRIHELASDFTVEDVWSFRTPGAGPDDFPVMLAAMRAAGGIDNQPGVAKFLFAFRWKVGELFGWDKPAAGLNSRIASLRDRLPSDLPATSTELDDDRLPLKPVYALEREAALEIANKTVHALMHLGWVQGSQGDYELRMAVLVKPNGSFGRRYMAAIAPFRYLVIYPALTRRWEQAWLDREQLLTQ
ncbi:DUF2867 domain-containing protein [Kribbella sp. NPDC056951]|uniref:DUF2867 domain-containing protein n=1 Tax=Kribbella sp. NPDC056951 TaxID=3345978 RepID=UPI00362CE015